MTWKHKTLSTEPDYIAPDGSEIRLLTDLTRANMAHFRLAPGKTSKAVANRTIEEFWFIVDGCGEMWLKYENEKGKTVTLEPGVSIALPPGTHFQFRSRGERALDVVGVSVPRWPGDQESYPVEGAWPADLGVE